MISRRPRIRLPHAKDKLHVQIRSRVADGHCLCLHLCYGVCPHLGLRSVGVSTGNLQYEYARSGDFYDDGDELVYRKFHCVGTCLFYSQADLGVFRQNFWFGLYIPTAMNKIRCVNRYLTPLTEME